MNKAVQKLNSSLITSGACILYSGKGDGKGYGRITWRENGKVKTVAAHRLAYETHVGPIPEGQLIRHLCHNPRCVNVLHLRPGTPAENSRDMVEAGRSLKRYGEKNPNSKITDRERGEIIAARKNGETLKSIAGRYGVHLSTIGKICQKAKPQQLNLI